MTKTSEKDMGRLEEAVKNIKDVTETIAKSQSDNRDKFFDIFDKMNTGITTLNANMNNLVTTFGKHEASDYGFHESMEKRVEVLEANKNKLAGAAAVLGISGGALGGLLTKLIH